ncbi:hypothetical protein [Novosphingobium sp.]
MKVWFATAAGVVIILAMGIMAVAWIRGGVQPARVVEIPASTASTAGGAA